MLLEHKFVYVVVHPTKEVVNPEVGQAIYYQNFDFSWQTHRKKILKLFGKSNPFSTVDI